MNIADAKAAIKDLGAALTTIAAALDSVGGGEKQLDALLERKAKIDEQIQAAQDKLKEVGKTTADQMATLEAHLKQSKTSAAKEIAELEDQIAALKKSIADTREQARRNLASDRAEAASEKQKTISLLDQQIAAKTRQLNELNAAIEEGKRRFA